MKMFLPLAGLIILTCGFFSVSCSDGPPASEDDGITRLAVWAHSGREAERETLKKQVARFNAANPNLSLKLTILPEGRYNAQVQAAALAGDLPDILEFDGPFVYNYVWQGYLRPLGDLLGPKTLDNLLPSIRQQGTYGKKFYSVGIFDSGLGLYGRKSLLEKVGARLPQSPDAAWTVEEMEQVLSELAREDADGQVLDLKLNYSGEWFTYAFSPALQSAGGDLINRETLERASGVLDSDASVKAMKVLQRWMDEDNRVDPNLDDNAFTGGRVALSWVGHWEFPRYAKAFGEDLVLLPLPDFGEGSRTGMGSWNWAITQKCEAPRKAARFLRFLLQDRQVLEMTQANGAVPATHSAIAKSNAYKPGGPLHLFVKQLTDGTAVPRPKTPAYGVITSVFQDIFDDVRNGRPPREALEEGARLIDQDIADNQGYPARN